MDGNFGLKKIEELRPDVVTLDLEMPRMDGMETLRQLTRKHRLPVIVVSAHSVNGAAATFQALSLGAFDFVPKPFDASQARMDGISEQLATKIKAAAHFGIPRSRLSVPEDFRPQKPAQKPNQAPTKIVAIGISTGGPNALQYLLQQLPGDFPGTIVVVQHMPEGFTEMFARRLDESCAIDVKEAQSGDLLIAGRALICPGDRHIKVRSMPLGNTVVLSDEARTNGHRPSVDILFRSVAAEFGSRAVGVLMTGMGDDGADGLGLMKDAGALTIAQSEDSCTVFGMPKAAVERGHAMRIVPLDMLANTLAMQCNPEKIARAVVKV